MAGRNEGGNNLHGMLLTALLLTSGGSTLVGARGSNRIGDELEQIRKTVAEAMTRVEGMDRELKNQGERLRALEESHRPGPRAK